MPSNAAASSISALAFRSSALDVAGEDSVAKDIADRARSTASVNRPWRTKERARRVRESGRAKKGVRGHTTHLRGLKLGFDQAETAEPDVPGLAPHARPDDVDRLREVVLRRRPGERDDIVHDTARRGGERSLPPLLTCRPQTPSDSRCAAQCTHRMCSYIYLGVSLSLLPADWVDGWNATCFSKRKPIRQGNPLLWEVASASQSCRGAI